MSEGISALFGMEGLTNGDIIAASAMIVSLCALFTTFWQCILVRIHNRLSVKPYLDITHSTYNDSSTSIKLSNVGLGPSIIDSYELSLDGKYVDTDLEGFKFVCNELGVKSMCKERTLDNTDIIAADNTIYLFQVMTDADKIDDNSMEALLQLKQRVNIKINYSSIYGDKQTLHWP